MPDHITNQDKMLTIWNQVMSNLEKVIPQEQFSDWIMPLQPTAYNAHVLTLSSPSQFHKEWMEDNYATIISSAVSVIAKNPVRIEFIVRAD